MMFFCGMNSGCRGRRASTEEAILPFVTVDTDAPISSLKQVFTEAVSVDAGQEVQKSLRETLAEIQQEFPDDENLARTRHRTFTELTNYVAALHDPSPSTQEERPDMPSIPRVHDGFADHAKLTQALYSAEGINLEEQQGRATAFLKTMGLRTCDSGVRNKDDSGATLWNQCFYLSMARAFLGVDARSATASGLALRFRRAVETAVLAEHPTWADGIRASSAGEGQAMIFADFLPIAMRQEDSPDNPNLTARLAVCILDSIGGHAEVYLGPNYSTDCSRSEQVQHLILLWYVPGHYQCIVQDDVAGSKVPMTYEEFKQMMSKHGVVYIETVE